MSELTTQLREVLKPRAKAPAQAGIFAGADPSVYDSTDPIKLWVIQVIIIIAFTQLLALLLSRIRQPRVIAEVIGGIILGPSIVGRIPNFSAKIFPTASLPLFTLTANIGLVLFLFLVGLEIDVRVVKRNIRSSTAVSIAGLIVPLGMGAALGVPLYHEFIDDSVNFGYFLLFTAVAIGITAFPVLCRILTELKLLDTTVGVVALSAGVGNDIVGWVLLALTVALVNAANGLTALWVLLTGIGFVIFMLLPVKYAFRLLAKRTGSLETGHPTAFMMTVTLLTVFTSAFFTDIIGIHPIFGGFLAGLIIPREITISLVEKIEDLVTLLFLPLYFVLSGLRTNLGLLDNGVTWGYTFLICAFAFVSKFVACATAAKLSGFNVRESGAIGSLMSCKGLVELIVLNVGLTAGILDTRTFSMFVVHALILTFMTTPLTLLFYPAKHRVHLGEVKELKTGTEEAASEELEGDLKTRFAMVLDKIEQLPAAMTITQMLQSSSMSVASITTGSEKDSTVFDGGLPYRHTHDTPITMDVLRLIELTDRTSAVLKSQEAETLVLTDPVVSIFRTFARLHRMAVSSALSVVSYDDFPSSVAKHVQASASQMVILPWPRAASASVPQDDTMRADGTTPNPFDGVFADRHTAPTRDPTSSVVYTEFIRKVFAESSCDVGLFVDRGTSLGTSPDGKQHIFLPFFGGPDDRLALSFVVQLCCNAGVQATVVRIRKTDGDEASVVSAIDDSKKAPIHHNTTTFADTVYGHRDTQTQVASATADQLLWDRFTRQSLGSPVGAAISRITFTERSSAKPLHDISEQIHQLGDRLLVVTGRSRRMAVESHAVELRHLVAKKGKSIGSEIPKTLGDVGAALVATGANASVMVVQAKERF